MYIYIVKRKVMTSKQEYLLKEDFKSYLSLEKELYRSQRQFQIYLDFNKDKANMFSRRCDLLEKRLFDHVKISCEAFKITPEQYVDLLNETVSQ